MARRVMLVEVQAQATGAKTYTTLNPSDKGANIALSGGNLVVAKSSGAAYQSVRTVLGLSYGKWYWEVQSTAGTAGLDYLTFGFANISAPMSAQCGNDANGFGWTCNGSPPGVLTAGSLTTDGSTTTLSVGQWGMVAIDIDAGKAWLGNNGVWAFSGNPETGANPSFTFTPGMTIYPCVSVYATPQTATINLGATAFNKTVPGGFNAGVYTVGAPTANTLYLASERVVSETSATPSNQLYRVRLAAGTDPAMKRRGGCWVWGANSAQSSIGELEFHNADRSLDGWRDLIFRDRPVTIRYGTEKQVLQPGNCTVWAEGIVDRVEFTAQTVKLILLDKLAKLDKSGQTNMYLSTVAITELRDQPKPVLYGKGANTDPVLRDGTLRLYDIHDGAIAGIDEVTDQADPDVAITDYRYITGGFVRLVKAVGKMAATARGGVKQGSSVLSEQFTAWSGGVFDADPTGWTVAGESSVNERVAQINSGKCTFKKSGGATAVSIEKDLSLVAGNLYLIRVNVTTATTSTLIFQTATSGGVLSVEQFRIDTTNVGVGIHEFCVTPAAGHTRIRLTASASTTQTTELEWLEVWNATLIERLPDWLEMLAVTRGGLTTGDLDTAAIAALDVKAPYKLNYFSRTQWNIKDVLRQTMDSYTGWAIQDRLGKITVGRLEAPSSTPVLTLVADDLKDEWTCKQDLAPALTTRAGALRNWTQHGDADFVSTVSDAVRFRLKQLFQQVRSAQGFVDSTVYNHAIGAPYLPTLLQLIADALAEISRIVSYYSIPRFIYAGPAFLDQTTVLTLKPGDTVRLVQDKFDLAAGKNLLLLGIESRFFSQRVNLELIG